MGMALALFMFNSCDKEMIRGSGPVITESRQVGSFTRVKINGSTDLQIRQGTEFKLELTGYANILGYLETEVRNGELTIGFRNNTGIMNDNSAAMVTMPSLEAVTGNGSSSTRVTGPFYIDAFSAHLAGSCDLSVENCSGRAISVQIDGSGNFKAFDFPGKKAEIRMSGSGQAEMNVSDELDIWISGSGKVYYQGYPAIYTHISGSGQVTRK
jgi:hypothetical protein